MNFSEYHILYRKGYKPQFIEKVFEVSAKSTKKSPAYIIKDLEKTKSARGYKERKMYSVLLRHYKKTFRNDL